MEFTARVSWVRCYLNKSLLFSTLALALFALASCSTTSSSSKVDATDAYGDGYASGDRISWDGTNTDGYTFGSEQLNKIALLESVDNQFNIQSFNGNGFERYIISSSKPFSPDEFEALELTAPQRVVVDLFSAPTRVSRVIPTEQSNFFNAIRVGAHSDKSRIVFDVDQTTTTAEHTIELINGDIALTIFRPEMADTVANMNWGAGTASTFAANMNEPYMGTEPAFSSPPVPEYMPPMNQAPYTATPAFTQPRLTGMSIEDIGAQANMLVVDMESAGFYSLKKTAPSEYVLRLEGAMLEEDAANAIVAPPQSGQIRSVRPIVQGTDVLLRIFAQPNSTLQARSRGNKIIVSPTNEFAQFTDATTRAQANEVEISDADTTAAGPQTGDAEFDSELSALLEDTPKYTGRLISLDLQDTDIDNALRIIAEVSNLNIIASDDVTGKVTLRLIDVPWDQALDVILKTQGLDKVQELNVIRIAPVEKLRQEREALKQAREAEIELEPLNVKYIRISYARSSELKPLIEAVISERGTVAYDERTNQIIVKDVKSGIKNVAQLVAKLDLRTPQVLLETQIVEAQRTLMRELGTELGFQLIQSPETGNATGYNFPNSIDIGGSVDPGSPVTSSFPASVSDAAGSAVSLLFDSADGTKSLDMRISALEEEGRLRIISRPAVATTNNEQATIKSVEKIRVKTPSGGLSVATGTGATSTGGGTTATEVVEIGITLEVTPQASPDYFVLLDVNAKSSTFGSREVDGIPSEVERSATSTVLVSSGQTFAMGGIYKISDRDNISGVPFFKDIPFLGHLFRRSSIDNSDEELIFFITPRIIEGSFDDAAMRGIS